MRLKRTLLASLGSLLTGTGLALADDVPAPLPAAAAAEVAPAAQPAPPAPPPAPCLPLAGECDRGIRMWGTAEYLAWWMKDAPSPVPLVTAGPTVPNLAPVLGAPGTRVVLGSGGVALDTFSGGRFAIGGWLNRDAAFGAEAVYLFLGDRSVGRSVSSTAAPGSAFLAVPFVNAQTGLESSTRLAAPGEFAGLGRLSVSSGLQNGELNGVWNLSRGPEWTVNLVGGFRYLNLHERWTFETSSPAVVGPADVFTTRDSFAAENDFYGGQLGLRVERQSGRWFVNATTKVALGNMHRQVTASGELVTNDFSGFTVPQVFPGGYFTQPTNLGSPANDRFSVVADVSASVGYQLTRAARVFAGYSFLYASAVARPGDQVDRRINPSQAAAIVGVPAGLVGPAAPVPQLRSSDFWAHGLNVGLDLRY
ncbi:BBP7 family outer membrane beta-barrel protein [Gemmata sp.]|uniref:BBP7 family outer membrane beta-barrel protein n=1 Tax=Gemmata sp. TaxID=1914242 RepID=UPI003F6EE577